jgi:hypothetical protein
VLALKGEDYMIRKCISRARKSARIQNIIDKSVMIALWTPVIVIVYLQAGLLTYRYSKTNTAYDSAID